LEALERAEGHIENGDLVCAAFVVPADGEPVIHVWVMPYTDNIREMTIAEVIGDAS
jgi:hypothetical protein